MPLPARSLAAWFLSATLLAAASPTRTWTSAEGGKTMEATFVRLQGEMLTLRTGDGKATTFPLRLLAAADRAAAQELAAKAGAPPERITLFAGFRFGTTPDEVLRAVRGMPGVAGSLPREYLARTGLNGIFHTTLADERFDLFFGYGAGDSLTDVNLHSPPAETKDYAGRTKETWARLRHILEAQFGQPALTQAFPPVDRMAEGQLFFTEWWSKDDRHYGLGVGMLAGKVSCVVRCTNQSPPKAPL